MSGDVNDGGSRRLNGWTEIARYLQRDLGREPSVRTLQRWAADKELPLPSYKEKSSVFAYTGELDEWRAQRIRRNAPVQAPPTEPAPARPRRLAWWLVCAGILLVAMAAAIWGVRNGDVLPPPPPAIGRLLARATSEGQSPQPIYLNYRSDLLAITPDGRQIFAVAPDSATVSVVQPDTQKVDIVPMPWDVRAIAMSPDGRYLYAASRIDGIAVIDTRSHRIVARHPTPGEVYDLAVTADGRKVFLALSYKGLWRMTTSSGALRQMTSQRCAQYLQIGPHDRLFVGFQCGGAIGRSGHDTVEVYDTATERLLGRAAGPPMVAGPLAPSPDGMVLALDSQDGCIAPQYDHQGCPPVPSVALYLLDLSDFHFTRSKVLPVHSGVVRFVDRKHLLLAGDHITVLDVAQSVEVERWENHPASFNSIALDLDHRKVYLGTDDSNVIYSLDAEPPACAPPPSGLVAFYSGDGVLADSAGADPLTAQGSFQFCPGRVGQAFCLDGKSGFVAGPATSSNMFGYRDSSFVAYVKFHSVGSPMTIFQRNLQDRRESGRLAKRADGRIALDLGTGSSQAHLVSASPLEAEHWYQVAVTKSDSAVALYLNGGLQDQHRFTSGRVDLSPTGSLVLGAAADGREILNGKLDEVLLYNRAFSPAEVRQLYELREPGGSCRF